MRRAGLVSCLLVVAVLSGCQTAAPRTHMVVPAAQSPLSFVHPDGIPLKARFQRPAAANPAMQTVTGFWRPASGASFPVVQITLDRLAPGHYFAAGSGNVVDTYVSHMRFGDLGTAVPGETGKYENALGPVNVQRFTIKDVNCFAFEQSWGGQAGMAGVTGRAVERLLGYYCGGTGQPAIGEFIAEVVRAIEVSEDTARPRLSG